MAAATELLDAPDGYVAERFTQEDGLPTLGLYDVTQGSDGRLYFATMDGLVIWDGEAFVTRRTEQPGGPPSDRLYGVHARDHLLYVITGDSIVAMDAEGIRKQTPLGGAGDPWVRPYGDTEAVYRNNVPFHIGVPSEPYPDAGIMPAHRTPPDYDIVDQTVFDRSHHALMEVGGRPTDWLQVGDSLWVLTAGHGLYRVRKTPLTVHVPPSDTRVVSQVFLDAEGEPFGPLLDGSGFFHPRDSRISVFPWPQEERERLFVFSWPTPVLAPWGARLWSSFDGVYEEAGTGVRQLLPLPDCAPAHARPDATLLDGSVLLGAGVRLTDHGPEVVGERPCAAPLLRAASIEPIDEETVAVAGPDGVHVVQVQTGQSQATPLSEPTRHLRLDGEVLWAATETRGLCGVPVQRLFESDAWQCLGRARGFPENQIHATAHDGQGRVAISSNRGLYLVRREALQRFATQETTVPFVLLGRDFGLHDPELNGYLGRGVAADRAGDLWFPGQAGLIQYDPRAFAVPTTTPFSVAEVWVGDRLHAPSGLQLPTNPDPVRLELQLLDPGWQREAEFRWRFAGGAWRKTSSTLALPRLPPGRSSIELQARLLDDWTTTTWTVVRAPALMERSWFAGLVALIFAGLSLALLLWRLHLGRRRAATLTRAVAERTEELAQVNDKLQDQAERLTALDAHKSRLIADLAHELRTPLTLVIGNIESLPETVQRARALDSAQRLSKLTGELMNLSQADVGELRLRARRMDLRDVVSGVCATFQGSLQQRELLVHVPDDARVWADPNLIETMVSNLLQNAMRYGSGAVVARAVPMEDCFRVEVRDHGPGVPEADRARVFERFVQLSAGDTRQHTGMGIGLSIVAELARLHGGNIGVDAPEGGGACFWFTLPRGRDHLALDDLDLEHQSDTATAPAPAPVAGAPTLVIVEDNPEIRAFLVDLLAEAYTVLTATDGEEGLALITQTRPDLVVSDVRMPRLDGLSMARRLRDSPDTASIPILLVSAKTQHADRAAGLAVADDYLIKPFGLAELQARIRRLLPDPILLQPQSTPQGNAAVDPFVERLTQVIDHNLADAAFKPGTLAKRMAMAPRTLQERCQAHGLPTPRTVLLHARLRRGQDHLRARTFETVGEVAAAVGLSRAYFSRSYRAWAGHSPTQAVGQG